MGRLALDCLRLLVPAGERRVGVGTGVDTGGLAGGDPWWRRGPPAARGGARTRAALLMLEASSAGRGASDVCMVHGGSAGGSAARRRRSVLRWRGGTAGLAPEGHRRPAVTASVLRPVATLYRVMQ